MGLKDFLLKKESTEDKIMNSTINELFDFMTLKLLKNNKPVKLEFLYLDMKFTVTAELIDDFADELKKHEKGVIIE